MNEASEARMAAYVQQIARLSEAIEDLEQAVRSHLKARVPAAIPFTDDNELWWKKHLGVWCFVVRRPDGAWTPLSNMPVHTRREAARYFPALLFEAMPKAYVEAIESTRAASDEVQYLVAKVLGEEDEHRND